jgi:RNA polymerase sigma-70 factor (ECF subfamily)
MRKREKSRATYSLDTVVSTNEGELERQIEDPNASPADQSERNERERLVQEAVAMLPEYQRAMIVMFHAESLSYEEIAEALDLPIGTVKSRLNRARLSLREQLVKSEELFDIV